MISSYAAAAQPAPDTVRVSLAAAIDQSLAASPEVRAAEADVAFAEARQGEARASRFLTEFQATTAHALAPALTIPEEPAEEPFYLRRGLDNDWDDVRPFNQIEVEALQPIYTWGQLGGSLRAARFGAEAERARVSGTALEVANRTAEIYYNLLLTEELFRIAQETGDILERARDEIQRLLDEGAEDVDYADLYQLQLTEQEYRRRLVEVRERRATARTALRRQLFLPEGTTVAIAEAFLEPLVFTPDSLDAYQRLAVQFRPEVQQAEAGLRARDALVEVVRSDFYPKLFAQGSYAYAYAQGRVDIENPFLDDPYQRNSFRAGIGIRQKLNFFQTRARVEQRAAERNKVDHQLAAAQQLALFEVEDAYRRHLIEEAALEAADEALTISERWLRDEQINFDLDLGDTENLVRAVRANLQQQAAYYQAVRDYNLSVIRLLRKAGILVEQAGTLTTEE